ncbi:MAG: PilZ domain-containing protein [Candidatus Aminicenantes bacterium]|nr:MAG: PilZ domain-containing protein [Candidatus Aminicenantes bacterium]
MTEEKESPIRRRLFPRYKLPVYYRPVRSLGQKQQLQDIGLGGMRTYSNKPLKVGKEIQIKLFLPKGSSVEAIARVAWIKSLPPGSEAVYDIGFEFIDLSAEGHLELKTAFENASPEE